MPHDDANLDRENPARAGASAPADRNVERLLQAAYRPERARAEFRARVEQAMLDTARAARPRRPLGPVFRALMGVAAGLLLAAGTYLTLRMLYPPIVPAGPGPGIALTDGTSAENGTDLAAPVWQAGYLLPRRSPAAVPAGRLAAGQELRTGADERRRLRLEDGSLLYVDEHSALRAEGPRRLELKTGRIYLELAPVAAGGSTGGEAAFVVRTPAGPVQAAGTRFGVSLSGEAGQVQARVVVTQGQVRAGEAGEVVPAGREITFRAAGAAGPSRAAPRASAELDWMSGLVRSARTPLVPDSKYGGGALVCVDPSGQEARLSLRRYHVDVHVEDGFARTTIDQTYFNHMYSRQEGTFYFPLPPDASLNRLAMYVEGKLMEGGMAEREHAREVYETILHQRRDPALLEWVDGSTFKMRVFPLEPRQEKRILISYIQRLPAQEQAARMVATYRFPGGHSLGLVGEWSFEARLAGWGERPAMANLLCDRRREGVDLVLAASGKNLKPDKDVVLTLPAPPGPDVRASARLASFEQDGKQYLMLRMKPDLPVRPGPRERRNWVFLFESSASRDPLLARVQIDVVRTLLENAAHDDTFAIVTAGTAASPLSDKPLPVTADHVRAAVDKLERTHLIGALDLGQALEACRPLLAGADDRGSPRKGLLVHVGGGIATLGERRQDVLVGLLPRGTEYVGVGVGKRWSRAFMQAAASASGGYVTQINPDEPAAWRAFELFSALSAPRLLDARVIDPAERAAFLSFDEVVLQGQELCAIAQLPAGRELPPALLATGTVAGQPWRQEVALRDVRRDAGYLPRMWARLEIDRLLARDAQANRARIIELSKAMYVMSPYTSLLVLENEEMYAQFKVDRGRKDHWAMYPAPAKIPVVTEWDRTTGPSPASADPPAAERQKQVIQVLESLQIRIPPRLLTWTGQPQPQAGGEVISAWQMLTGWGYNYDGGWTYARYHGKGGPAGGQTFTVSGIAVPNGGTLFLGGQRLDLDWNAEVGVPVLGRVPATRSLWTGGGSDTWAPIGVFQDSRNWVSSARRGVGSDIGSILTGNGTGLGGRFLDEVQADFLINSGETDYRSYSLPRLTLWNGQRVYDVPTSGRWGYADRLDGVGWANRFGRPDLTVATNDPFTGVAVPARPNLMPFGLSAGGTSRLLPSIAPPPRKKGDLQPPSPATTPPMRLAPNSPTNRPAEFRDAEIPWYELLRYPRNWKQIPSLDGSQSGSPYARPVFSRDLRAFDDLLAFCPGMNTAWTDVRATLEAEVPGSARPAGRIDPAAERLIDRARQLGWQHVTWPGDEWNQPVRVAFNGAGQYRIEHGVGDGLLEVVVCDGKRLWHLYPDVGVGAVRTVARVHRQELTALVPWHVPPAADLALGADLTLAGENVVQIAPARPERAGADAPPAPASASAPASAPADATRIVLHLVFDPATGRLTERRLVELPSAKVLARESYSADGVVTLAGPEGSEQTLLRLQAAPAAPPDLSVRDDELVILPLPYRTREHVLKARKLDGRRMQDYTRDDLHALLACDLVRSVGIDSYAGRELLRDGPRPRAGIYAVLLAAKPWKAQSYRYLDPVTQHGQTPLTTYIQQQIESGGSWPVDPPLIEQGPEFLQSLSRLRRLAVRDQAGRYRAGTSDQALGEDAAAALHLARTSREPTIAWAALSIAIGRPEPALNAPLVQAAARFDDLPGLGFFSRYERAVALAGTPQREQARELMADLLAQTAAGASWLMLDDRASAAFLQADAGPAGRAELYRAAGQRLDQPGLRHVLPLLAWQCFQAGQSQAADELITLALKEPAGQEHTAAALGAVQYLLATGRADRALEQLEPLLAGPLGQRADLWRLASQLALQASKVAPAARAMERALDLEEQAAAEVVNLEQVRADYGQLLQAYAQIAQASATLGQKPPDDLTARVIRSADRWRSLDNDPTAACQQAAHVLRLLGRKELAWDYLTTPLAERSNEAAPWVSLAEALKAQHEYAQADQAYATAFQAEPTNAQVLWDRAGLNVMMGNEARARDLYRQLAQGKWEPRFQNLQHQAQQRIR